MKKQQGAVSLVLAPGRMLICPPAHFTEVQRNDLPGVPGGCPHRALAWVRILFYSLFRQPHARVHAAKPARQFVQFYEVSGTLYIQVLSFCVLRRPKMNHYLDYLRTGKCQFGDLCSWVSRRSFQLWPLLSFCMPCLPRYCNSHRSAV